MEIFFIAGSYGCLIFNVVILMYIHNSIKQFHKTVQDNFDDMKKTIRNKKFKRNEL